MTPNFIARILKRNLDFFIILPLFLLIFSTSFFSGPLWDDYVFIFKSNNIIHAPNPFVYWQGDSGYTRAWPLGYSLFWILYRLFFHHYIFYKLLNLLLHFSNYLLLKKIGVHLKLSQKLTSVVALLFLIHPLQVESISWIFQMNTILAMTLFLLSIHTALKKHNHKNYIISFILFTASLLVKSYYVAFAPLFFFIIRKKIYSKLFYTTLFLGISLYMTYETLKGVQYSSIEKKHKEVFHEKVHFKKTNKGPAQRRPTIQESNTTVHSKIELTISKLSFLSHNFVFYLFNFLFPFNLHFIYSEINLVSPFILIAVFLSIIIAIFSFSTAYEKMALTTTLLAFLPVSGLFYVPFMKYSPIADHWAYSLTPSLCFLFIKITGLLKRENWLIITIFYFTFQTLNYGKTFNNQEAMLLRNIKYAPHSAFLYNYLAFYYKNKGHYSNAYQYSKKALELEPSSVTYQVMFYQNKKLWENEQ